jgi:thiamine biosynthesis protein ThiS
MRITVNGALHEFPLSGPGTLEDLINHLGLPADRVAVEHNGVVVRRADRGRQAIGDGDVREIVTRVGGG